MPLCFAYGSNMDVDAMAARCPASRPVGLARLPRHRLAMVREGYLSVTRDPRRDVHGLLWDIAFADMPALDRYEAVASGLYSKVQQAVITGRGPRRAIVYVGRNAGPGEPLPGYLDGVVEAARRLGLPPDALRELEALVPGAARGRLAPSSPARERPRVTPTRATPFDRPRDPSAGWRWSP